MRILLPALLLVATSLLAGEAPWFPDPGARLGGQLVQLGSPDAVTIDPGFVGGDEPLSFQWLKDGKPVARAAQQVLELPTITRREAGVYSLRVTNRFGKAESGDFFLVVVGDRASRSFTLKVQDRVVLSVPNVWGPATFVWTDAGGNESDFTRKLGHGPTAEMTGDFGDTSLNLTAQVSVDAGGYTLPPVPAADFEITLRMPPSLDPSSFQEWLELTQGVPFQQIVFANQSADLVFEKPLPDLRVVNAPPGLEVKQLANPDGGVWWYLVGRPSKPGFYDTTLIASNSAGEARTTLHLTVRPFSMRPGQPGEPGQAWKNTIGHYECVIWKNGTQAVAHVKLDVAFDGTCSGRMSAGTQAASFVSQLNANGVWEIPLPQLGKEIAMTITADLGVMYSMLYDGTEFLGQGNAFGSSWQRVTFPRSHAVRSHLLLSSTTDARASALAVLDVRKSGNATLALRLSDGSVVTDSSPLDDGGRFICYQALQHGNEWLVGELGMDLTGPAAPVFGTLRWVRSADKKFPAAIDTNLELSANKSCTYRQAMRTERFLGLENLDDNVTLSVTGTLPGSTVLPGSFTLGPEGMSVVEGNNPGGFRLYVNPQTGIALARFLVRQDGLADQMVWANGLVIGTHGGEPPARIYLLANVPDTSMAAAVGSVKPVLLTISPSVFLNVPAPLSVAAASPPDTDAELLSGTLDVPMKVTTIVGGSVSMRAHTRLKAGETIQWKSESLSAVIDRVRLPLEPDNDVIGPRSKVLTLHHLPAGADQLLCTAWVTSADGSERLVAAYLLRVIATPGWGALNTSMMFDVGVVSVQDLGSRTDSFDVKGRGLPAGLRVARQTFTTDDGSSEERWAIVGIPLRAGFFPVTLTATNAAGRSIVTVFVHVLPLPFKASGAYFGLIYEDSYGRLPGGGKLALQLTRTGSFTGSLTTLNGTEAITGSFNRIDYTYDAGVGMRRADVRLKPRAGSPDLRLEIYIDTSNGGVTGFVRGMTSPDGLPSDAVVSLMPVAPGPAQRIHALLTVYRDELPPGLAVFDSPGGADVNVVARLDGKVFTSKGLHTSSPLFPQDIASFYSVIRPGVEVVRGAFSGGYGDVIHIVLPTKPEETGVGVSYELAMSSWTPMRDDQVLLDAPYTTPNLQFDGALASWRPGQSEFAATLFDPNDGSTVAWTMKLNRKLGVFTATRTTSAAAHYFGLVFPELKKAVGIDWKPPAALSDTPLMMEIKAAPQP